MRRPTKELVDAVPGALDERGRAGSVRALSEGAGSTEPRTGGQGGEKAVRTVVIKKEAEGEGYAAWDHGDRRGEPGSPLERKSEASAGPMGGLPASVLTERRRRVSGFVRDEAREQRDGETARDGAASAVKALVVGMGRKERDGRNREREREREKDKNGGGGDVYDFHGSESETESRAAMEATGTAKARDGDCNGAGSRDAGGSLPPTDRIRVSRRVSSVAEGLAKGEVGGKARDGLGGASTAGRAGEPVKSTTGSLRGRKRRDTLASAGGDGDVEGNGNGNGKEDGGAGAGMGAGTGTRAEKAVGRRRSMMI